jgi:hypothetical protein
VYVAALASLMLVIGLFPTLPERLWHVVFGG